MNYQEIRENLVVLKNEGLDYPSQLDVSLVYLANEDPEGYKSLKEEFPEMLEKNDFMNPEEIGLKSYIAPYMGYGEVFNYVKPMLEEHGKKFSEEEFDKIWSWVEYIYTEQDQQIEMTDVMVQEFKEETGEDLENIRTFFEW